MKIKLSKKKQVLKESKQKEKNFFRDGNFSQEYVNQVLAEELEKVINEELNPLEIKKSICDNKDMILGAIKAGKVNNMLWWAEALGVIPEEMEQARETLENLLGTDPDKILSTPGAKEGAVAAIELMCMLRLDELGAVQSGALGAAMKAADNQRRAIGKTPKPAISLGAVPSGPVSAALKASGYTDDQIADLLLKGPRRQADPAQQDPGGATLATGYEDRLKAAMARYAADPESTYAPSSAANTSVYGRPGFSLGPVRDEGREAYRKFYRDVDKYDVKHLLGRKDFTWGPKHQKTYDAMIKKMR